MDPFHPFPNLKHSTLFKRMDMDGDFTHPKKPFTPKVIIDWILSRKSYEKFSGALLLVLARLEIPHPSTITKNEINFN